MTKSELREYAEALAVAVVLAVFIIVFIAQSFLVHGQSMEPTLHNGERLLVDKLTYRFRPPNRGEIVVFQYPADPRRRFIKRIIGVPGDTIEIHDNVVYLNGIPLQEEYVQGPTRWMHPGPVTVPPDHYFVLGDNRLNSDDSRFQDVGFVPRRNVVGRAVFVYWPLTRIGLVEVPAVFAEAGR